MGGKPRSGHSVSAAHAGYSHHWWTPLRWMLWATATLEDSFDPCPGHWTPDKPSGLDIPWMNDAYVNHPGGRGQLDLWWDKMLREMDKRGIDVIWCAFNHEQFRRAEPRAWMMPGYMVLPDTRIRYIWGGKTGWYKSGKTRVHRVHGEAMRSPTNYSTFWTSAFPKPTPDPCTIVPTGERSADHPGGPWRYEP